MSGMWIDVIFFLVGVGVAVGFVIAYVGRDRLYLDQFPEPLDETNGEPTTRWRYTPPCAHPWVEWDVAHGPPATGPMTCAYCDEQYAAEQLAVEPTRVYVRRQS